MQIVNEARETPRERRRRARAIGNPRKGDNLWLLLLLLGFLYLAVHAAVWSLT